MNKVTLLLKRSIFQLTYLGNWVFVVFFILINENLVAQTTITTQISNIDNLQTINNGGNSAAGQFNNGAELGNYANQKLGSNTTPGAVSFRTFTTNQTATSGTARTLRPGDRFLITAYATTPATSGIIGISFKNNNTFTSVSDYNNGQICRFELNDAGNWTVVHSGGTINTGFTSGADRTLQLDIISSNTFNATIAGTTYYNLDFISAGPVASFCIYNMVTAAAVNRSNPDSYWKTASLQGRQINIGGTSNATITGNISNGGNENSTTLSTTNVVFSGSNITTLTATNTYTGTTAITAGTVRLGIANALPNTNISISNNATLSTGAASGFSQTLGVLTMANSATIALGTGIHTLSFANSNGASWVGTLTINGWSPLTQQVIFGTTNMGLSPAQLAQINFAGFGTGAKILSTGQILPANFYISAQSGLYNTASTWVGNAVPPSGAIVYINHNSVTLDVNATVSQMVILSSGTLIGADASPHTLTIAISASSVSFINNGSFTCTPNNTIVFSSTGANVTHTITGNCIFNNVSIAKTIGTPQIGVTFSATSLINNNFIINNGGFVTGTAPSYLSSSTLIYNSGIAYGVSLEWTANATSGQGWPANVQIGNGATGSALVLGNSNYYCQGSLTLNNATGVALTMDAGGGNVFIGGSWINNGTTANFSANAGTINFINTGGFNIGGTNTNIGGYAFNNLTIDKSSGSVTLLKPITIATLLTVNGSGTFSLNGNNLSVPAITGTSTTAIINNNSASNCTLTITGTATTSVGAGIQNGATGTLSIVKNGTGTQSFFGANTYSGNTTVSAGTLGIGSTTVGAGLSANSNYTFNGGNLLIANVPAASILNAGTINIQANTNITLSGTNAYTTNFTASNAIAWNAASTLTIFNWTPSANRIINVGNATGLNSAQLSKVNFDNYGIGSKIVGIEVRPAFYYVTIATGIGNYSDPASWLLNDKPVLNDGTEAIYIQGTFALDLNIATINLLRAEVGTSATFNITAGQRVNMFTTGDLRVNGIINMAGNSMIDLRANTNLQLGGTINMSSSATIDFAAGINMTATTSSANFSNAGTLNFLGVFSITGTNMLLLPNVNLRAGVAFGTNSYIQNGSSLFMLPGGFIDKNEPPFYNMGSNLVYNTGGGYARGSEWISTSGRGYPANVQIGTTTIFRLNNGSPTAVRQIAGNLTINAGRVFTMEDGPSGMSVPFTVLGDVNVNGELRLGNAIGGDIRVGGNYTIGASGSVFNNNRAVIFMGSTNQLITKTGGGIVYFDFFVVDKPAGNVQLTANTNGYIFAPLNNSSSLKVIQLLRGDLDMNDGVFTVEGNGVNSIIILVDNGPTARRIFTSTGVGEFKITGTFNTGSSNFTVASQNSGKLLFDNNVEVSTSVGVDFGTGNITTVNAIFRIDANGYVINNAPNYGIASTLVYNNGTGGFKRNFEWNTDAAGANRTGYPNAIIVQNNTPLQINSTDFPATFGLGCSGKMNIEAGSSVITAAMAFPLSIGDSLNIKGTLTLSTNANGNLNVGGSFTRTGTFVQNDRMVTFNNSNTGSINVVGGQTFTRMTVDKTNTSNLLSIDNPVTITNELFLQRGTFTLNNEVIIQSTATQTARIGQTTTPTNISMGYNGTGKFVIQRYLPIPTTSAGRRWRLLTAPLKSTNAPNINAAWQEGQVSVNRLSPANAFPGFGTAITRTNVAANGFDQGTTFNPSLQFFNAGVWAAVAATNTGAITDQKGYMLFVRGDRSIVVSSSTIAGNPTTLRPKGEINIGIVTTPLNPLYPTVVGNPYASAISFNNVLVNGVNPGTTAGRSFYIWDPKHTSGSNAVGGFVTCTSLGGGVYSVTANSSGYTSGSYDGTIESSMAFMVPASSGNIVFNESSKVSTNSTVGIASRPIENSGLRNMDFFTSNLYNTTGGNIRLIDGVNVVGNNRFDNAVNEKDAPKYTGLNAIDNLAILRDNKKLAIELRKKITHKDTVQYAFGALPQGDYQFKLIGKNLPNNLIGIFIDKFTGIKTVFTPNDTTTINFTISNDVASTATDRCFVVFKKAVHFNHFTASLLDNNANITWQTDNEINVTTQQLQRSSDGGKTFNTIYQLPIGENKYGASNYQFTDNALQPGLYTYRLKITTTSQETLYSNTLDIKLFNQSNDLFVFPNPIVNNKIQLHINKLGNGNYFINVFNSKGNQVFTQKINYINSSTTVTLMPLVQLNKGTYTIILKSNTGKTYTTQFLVL